MSSRVRKFGGGSNTFAGLCHRYANKVGVRMVQDIGDADIAIVIAHVGNVEEIASCRDAGCRVVHRLDEYFEDGESGWRKKKHEIVKVLNKLAHITIYQSRFVFDNVHPHLQATKWRIIHNGGDASRFRPARRVGDLIGHVTWGIGDRKRLDLLYDFIQSRPDLQFLLVGRHAESPLPFGDFTNVQMVGPVRRWRLPRLFRKMRMLYFPAENDPCPNTVIESLLCGVPVCYHPDGGTVELVKSCGEPLGQVDALLEQTDKYRSQCLNRKDLWFEGVFARYLEAAIPSGS